MSNLRKNNDLKCATQYPIILVHGTGLRDDKPLNNYWGRIPKALIKNGAKVFYGKQDAWGTIENNAKSLKENITKILEETKSEKVNIIAHSKGGLESRYMISSLGMEQYIASLTTISTPHHGSKTMDIIYKIPSSIISFIGIFVDYFYKLLGDENPSFMKTMYQFTTKEADKFNETNKNNQLVFYQSYSSKMKNVFSDIIFGFTYILVSNIEGENDGLVTTSSAIWGLNKGVITNSKNRGISHADSVDFMRMNLSGFDVRNIYIEIVNELKIKGY